MGISNDVSDVSIASSIAPDSILPTPFIPGSGNLFPKWPAKLDADSWDEWQFQAMSADGKTALAVVFFRHTVNAPAGFRVGINASWASPSNDKEGDVVWCSPVMLPRSIVTSDAANTTGVWRNEDSSQSISFKIPADLSSAVVSIQVPGKVVGTLTFNTQSLDLPATETETKASVFWWLRPIAIAGVDAHLTFFPQAKGTIEKGMSAYETGGRELILKSVEGSFGSFDRAWAVAPPHKALSHNWYIWGKTGRYFISIIWMMGRPATEGVLHGSARLYCDGELVSKTEKAIPASEGGVEGETFSVEYLEGDGLTGSFPPKNIGHRVKFEAGDKQWEFEFRHERLWYEMPIGPPRPGRTGVSGFLVSVSGGRVGSAGDIQGSGMVGGGIMP